jgi:hypothetical protein
MQDAADRRIEVLEAERQAPGPKVDESGRTLRAGYR